MSICLSHSICVSNFNKRKGVVEDNHLPLKKSPRLLSCSSMDDDELQAIQGLLLLISTTTSTPKIDDDNNNNGINSNLSDDSLRPSRRLCSDFCHVKNKNEDKFLTSGQKTTKFHQFISAYDLYYGMNEVIQKRLEKSDVDLVQNRLSIPGTKIISTEFLTESEEELLKSKKKIQVKVRGCYSVEDHNMQLARWNYHKKQGSTKEPGWKFVLIGGWNSLRKENRLEKHDLVRIVSFRSQGHLCLAILWDRKVLSVPPSWGKTGVRGGRKGGLTR